MSDSYTTGTYDILGNSSFGENAAGSAGISPYSASSDLGGVTTVTDDLTGAVTNIFHSFVNGLSSTASYLAGGIAGYVGGTGSVVGYDRYGQPLYRIVDPTTGAWTTSTSPAWPGGGGSPQNNPERVPTNYPGNSFWGWLINGLGFPAPKPAATVGAVPTTQTGTYASILQAPVVGDITGGQLLLGAGIALVAFVTLRSVVK